MSEQWDQDGFNSSSSLLREVAQALFIKTSREESLRDWYGRTLYSLCGRMALASLWDREEDSSSLSGASSGSPGGSFSRHKSNLLSGQGVSRSHVEERIREVFSSCLMLYPFLVPKEEQERVRESFVEEILEVYEAFGYFLVSGERLYPVAEKACEEEKVVIYRGSALPSFLSMAGLGIYTLPQYAREWERLDLGAFWGLPLENPADFYLGCLQRAVWLREKQPPLEEYEAFLFTPEGEKGWGSLTEIPERECTLIRRKTEEGEGERYYLARRDSGRLMVGEVSAYLQEGEEIRRLLTGLRMRAGTLPPIRFDLRGGIVTLEIPGEVLPPAENRVIRLFTWPADPFHLPCAEKRRTPALVFDGIRKELSALGYVFTPLRKEKPFPPGGKGKGQPRKKSL